MGAWFGERALMYNEPRAADVYASPEDGASCYTISAKLFKDLLGNKDEVLAKIDKEMKYQYLVSLGLVENIKRWAELEGQ